MSEDNNPKKQGMTTEEAKNSIPSDKKKSDTRKAIKKAEKNAEEVKDDSRWQANVSSKKK